MRADASRRRGAHIRERNRDQRAVSDAADQIADEDPAPIDDNGRGARLTAEPGQWHQREAAGDKFEAKEHDADQPDWKDQRADQRCVGLYRAGKGETRGDAEDGAGQHAADQQIARRQSKLTPAGFDHRDCHVGGFHIIGSVHRSLLHAFAARAP
jgi:hypothetical protein